jgi:hypothetical protein
MRYPPHAEGAIIEVGLVKVLRPVAAPPARPRPRPPRPRRVGHGRRRKTNSSLAELVGSLRHRIRQALPLLLNQEPLVSPALIDLEIELDDGIRPEPIGHPAACSQRSHSPKSPVHPSWPTQSHPPRKPMRNRLPKKAKQFRIAHNRGAKHA